jgi:hypothetical protein
MILPRFFSDAESMLEMAAAPENKGRKRTGDELALEEAVTAANESEAMDIDEKVWTFPCHKSVPVVFSRLLQVTDTETSARPAKRPRLRARAFFDSRFTTLQLTCFI